MSELSRFLSIICKKEEKKVHEAVEVEDALEDVPIGFSIYIRGQGPKYRDDREWYFLLGQGGNITLWDTEEDAKMEIEKLRIAHVKTDLPHAEGDFLLKPVFYGDSGHVTIPMHISEEDVLQVTMGVL